MKTTIRTRLRRLTAALAIGVAILGGLTGSTCAADSILVPIDLGAPQGRFGEVRDLNDAGQVVGLSFPTSGVGAERAFSWTKAGGWLDLGTLGGSRAGAVAVSPSGQVVGYATTSANAMHAFSWTESDGMTDLGTLGSAGTSAAVDVNAAGQVVGMSEGRSFSWTKSGGMVDIGTLGGGLAFVAAVSDAGQAVGWSRTASGLEHAFSWTATGGMVDIGTLGGLLSQARAVNEAGQVVGWAYPAAERRHAFSWTAAGGMVDIGTLRPRIAASQAEAVNEAGQVVGYGTHGPGEGDNHAFSWTKAGGLVELDGDEGRVSAAFAINDAGQIVGTTNYLPNGPLATSWTSGGETAYLGEGNARAVNSSGEVAGVTQRVTSRATVWVNATVPSAPPEISATAGDGRASVTFGTPLSDGGLPVTHYTATASPGGRSASGTGSPITVGGLTNGTSYTFTVTATNGAGAGPPSDPSGAVIPTGSERGHPEPPSEEPRAAAPDFVAPSSPRPRPPAH